MPVTSRSLLINHVNGAGKKAPTNLRFSPTQKQIVNVNWDCNLPNDVSVIYIVAGSYTTELPLLPEGYVWQITGNIKSGGGGGGGGGGGIFDPFANANRSGEGGSAGNMSSSESINFRAFGGALITSVVGAGGAGGTRGAYSQQGGIGQVGNLTTVTTTGVLVISTFASGGIGGNAAMIGVPTVNHQGQIGQTVPGGGGSGGDGGNNEAYPGNPGQDGSVIFTARPIRV